MNGFKKQRFPKTCIALYIIAALTMFAIPVRIFLGGTFLFPADDAVFTQIVIPIIIIGVASLLCTLTLSLLLRGKGIKFTDLYFPVSLVGALAIFIFFHFALIS